MIAVSDASTRTVAPSRRTEKGCEQANVTAGLCVLVQHERVVFISRLRRRDRPDRECDAATSNLALTKITVSETRKKYMRFCIWIINKYIDKIKNTAR